jgi:AcrR family transcriptional regulator
MRPDERDPRKLIIDMATRLFAALGYDATSLEAIAGATDFGVRTISDLVGDKQTLYRIVMDRVEASERAMFDAAIIEFTPDRAGLHRLVDRTLDHYLTHPELAALWMHRWQSDAADIPELERVYVRPTFSRFRELIGELVPADSDADMVLLTFIWCIHCFCVGGFITGESMDEGQEKPIMLERFRAHLHRLADVLFGLEQ